MMPGNRRGSARNVEGVAELHEARTLVGSVRVDRTRQVMGMLAMTPIGRPSTRNEGGEDADAELRAKLQDGARIRDGVDDARMSYSRSRFSGTACRRRRWSGASQVDTVPWK